MVQKSKPESFRKRVWKAIINGEMKGIEVWRKSTKSAVK
jgi:hypothetical protein